MTEENLITELKKGNTTVLKHVYHHLDSIVSMVTKNSGTIEDGHDVFQEVVIIFYKNASKKEFQLSASIKTYLYAIARRVWLKKLKQRSKMVLSTFETSMKESLHDSLELELASTENINQRAVQLVDRLTGKCKQILQLFYFKNLSLEDIKEQLGYNSEHVVRQQKYRCLKTLRDDWRNESLNTNKL